MLGNPVDGSTTRAADDFIIVDATRCQNGEELATIIGQAINENPGKGALKALGGTFMPSMGNANRQDRYGWTELTYESYQVNGDIVGDGFSNLPFNHGEYFGDGTHSHLSFSHGINKWKCSKCVRTITRLWLDKNRHRW